MKCKLMVWLVLLASLFPQVILAQLQWGDQGNGTFINPVLNADFSDPDVIRVGEKYYMVASDFHFMGMQVLESDDMVNCVLLARYSTDWITRDGIPTSISGVVRGLQVFVGTMEGSMCFSVHTRRACL